MTITKKVCAGGEDYTLGALNLDQAEVIFADGGDLQMQSRELVRQSLLNGGHEEFSDRDIGLIPFVVFTALRKAALDLNGLTPAEGEAKAEATA